MNFWDIFGEMLVILFAIAAGYVALEALKAAGSTDKAAVKAALPDVTYTGVSGSIAFDEQGDAIRDTAYIKTADTANNAWTLETVQTVE